MAELNDTKLVFGLLFLLISQSVCVIDTVKDAVDNAKETVNDLLLEPVGDAIDKTREQIKDMTEKAKVQIEEVNENILNPYKEVMEMFKIDREEEFTENVLDKFLNKFVSKFHCKFGLFKRAAGCTSTMVSPLNQFSQVLQTWG